MACRVSGSGKGRGCGTDCCACVPPPAGAQMWWCRTPLSSNKRWLTWLTTHLATSTRCASAACALAGGAAQPESRLQVLFSRMACSPARPSLHAQGGKGVKQLQEQCAKLLKDAIASVEKVQLPGMQQTGSLAGLPALPGAKQKEVLALVVPYRNREEQLAVFATHMHLHLNQSGEHCGSCRGGLFCATHKTRITKTFPADVLCAGTIKQLRQTHCIACVDRTAWEERVCQG